MGLLQKFLLRKKMGHIFKFVYGKNNLSDLHHGSDI
jgi:hypothetical protein